MRHELAQLKASVGSNTLRGCVCRDEDIVDHGRRSLHGTRVVAHGWVPHAQSEVLVSRLGRDARRDVGRQE